MLKPLTKTSEWRNLVNHYREMETIHLRQLFDMDTHRFEKFSLETDELFLDFSKNHLTEKTLELLIQLAQQRKLSNAIEAMFNGELINSTENRAALHVALRNFENQNFKTKNNNIANDIKANLEKINIFSEKIRNGEWIGFTNKTITDIVNIGIGGSYLGPALAIEALTPFSHPNLKFHFLTNVDGIHLADLMNKVNLETTLFIISSKSFSTSETLTHAQVLKERYQQRGCEIKYLSRHFIAITHHVSKAITFGIVPENIFPIAEWVGGRYSLWSAIGLPLVIAIGMVCFKELLAGADSIDQHFHKTPLKQNMPVLLGLISIWYTNFFQTRAHAILPYSQSLQRLPAYLQQLTMESNGKNVTKDGQPLDYMTSPLIFGETGTNGQHSFYQLLHQGTQIIPADFIVPFQNSEFNQHQALLFANALSQSKVFMEGRTPEEIQGEMSAAGYEISEIQRLLNHKTLIGNRPSNTILFYHLTPRTLGALLALYEHKTFVESVIWNINPFDQWGVERGKQVADAILPNLLNPENSTKHDASTDGLIKKYHDFISKPR